MKTPLSFLKLTFILTITLQSFQLIAQGWRRNEMEIRVEVKDRTEAQNLSDLHLNGDIYFEYALLYVIPDELKLVQDAGFDYKITKENLNEYYKDFWESRDGYHSNQAIIALMDSLAAAMPDLVMKKVYGQSIQGRELSALKISDNVTLDENEAEVGFDGTIHGDEIGGSENCIRFARWLCQQYGNNTEITNLINNREIWIYPMVNPDGRQAITRTNAAGVDLNRDYGYCWYIGWGNGVEPYSQPETKAMRQMDYENQFSIHLSMHSGIEVMLYPWYFYDHPCPDEAGITKLVDIYKSNSGYTDLRVGPGSEIIFTTGTLAEYAYGVMGSYGLIIEISTNKQPSNPEYYFEINLQSMVKVIEYAGYGIEGTITNAETGSPVAASIFVDQTITCYSDPEVGGFHKYVLPGLHTIKVVANGYQTKVVSNINVNELSSTVVDIELEPEPHQNIYRVCAVPLSNSTGDTWDVIGQPDNLNFSLGKSGWIIFDLQEPILDGGGNDILVYEENGEPEGFTIFAGSSMDGPWNLMGTGNGTTAFDLAASTLVEARFFKIVDDGDGPENEPGAGFDLDAVQSIASITGTNILVNEIVINDSAGNNNGRIDPGEIVVFEIILKNLGIENASNVNGTLTSSDELINVQTISPQNFGEIRLGEMGSANFIVSANDQVPNGHTSIFALEIAGDNGISNTRYFEVIFPDYCFPSDVCSNGDGFSGFSLNTIENQDNGCNFFGYSDFTDMSTELTAGESYTVEWSSGHNNQNASLWIDLDNDKYFETDEMLIGNFIMAYSGQVYTKDFTLPEILIPGVKRMRIRACYQNVSTDPCASFILGETEDYTVVISSPGYLLPSFSASATQVCDGNQVQFTDNSSGIITAWDWQFPGGNPSTSNEQNPLITYENPGVFDVSLTISNEQNTQTITNNDFLTVLALPEVTFAEIEDMCVNWPAQELNGGFPEGGEYSGPGVSNGYFYPAEAGTGTHTLTYTFADENGCENFSEQLVYVDGCVGIEEPDDDFVLRPNPGNGAFYLYAKNDFIPHHISVSNILGKEVFKAKNICFTKGKPYKILLTGNLPGVYFLRISGEKERILKIIIQ
jgi:hypothetical protein